MKIKTALLVIIVMVFASDLFAWERLRVLDPQSWWHRTDGTIEEALVSIRPQGIYMEVGLYLTFSARDWYYGSDDTLEVEFYFDLPENSIVHDSWLWIGDEIIRGKIMDRWTAAAIYEDIVSRRKDPSILYKRGENSYELRIFPMAATETRKIKLTYLVPTQWSANSVEAILPTNLLQASRHPVPDMDLLAWLGDDWNNSNILGHSDISFQQITDPDEGIFFHAEIPTDLHNETLQFSVKAPFRNGVFVNMLEEETNSGIYQLAYLPSKTLDITESNKAAILVDYDVSNSDQSQTEVLSAVKSAIKSSFTERDSFNLILSNLEINRVSELWISADHESVDQVFSDLPETPLSNYSNLPSLLVKGIDFIDQVGGGDIILISNSDQVGDYEAANQLIEDLNALSNNQIPIHVADYQNQSYQYYRIGGRYYYGNEYFYTNVTRLTDANYFSLWDTYELPLDDLIKKTISSMGEPIVAFNLHTSVQGGYCYGRYNLSDLTSSIAPSSPILQVGKYNGSMPFEVEVAGVYNAQTFSELITVESDSIYQADSLSEEIWVGNYIHNLESQLQTNEVVSEIVEHSINERVLSIYTAFLCLEPARGGEVCYDCFDETNLVAITEDEAAAASDSLFNAYPNPFNNQVNISFAMPNVDGNSQITFTLFNILGQTVKTFSKEDGLVGQQFNFSWNGTDRSGANVASGTYFFVAQTSQKRHVLKLLFMK